MNYNSVILVGVVALTAAWWFIHARRHYPGPKVMNMYITDAHILQPPIAAGVLSTESEKKKQEL